MDAIVGPSRSQPLPGDGAYLAHPTPGDGRFLANGQSNGHGHNAIHRGHHRSGRGFARGRGRGGGYQDGPNGMSHRPVPPVSASQDPPVASNMTFNTKGHSAPGAFASNGTAGPRRQAPPHRPAQPREMVPIPQNEGPNTSTPTPPLAASSGNIPTTLNVDGAKKKKNGNRKPKSKPAENGYPPRPMSNGTIPAPLDPSVSAFTPGAPVPSSSTTPTSSTRASSPQPSSKAKKTRKPKSKQANGSESVAPPPPKSSRRAAFDQQTKLTTNKAASTSETSSPSAQSVGLPKEENTDSGRKNGTKRKEEKDDLVSRLTRGLKSRPYLECPICFNSINPNQPIWSCFPPTTPPPPPTFPDEIPVNPSSHYQACYTPFHLGCIRDWANRSLVEERERARGYGKDEEEVTWRCPGCQKRRKETVGGYRCFCGKFGNPVPAGGGNVPHGCAEGCSRKRPGCAHACPLTCHPGPCPPCQVALIVPCPSHHTPLTVKCALASSNNAAMTPVCDEICVRERDCGNLEHACKELCHYGPCSPCNAVERVKCYCGSEEKEASCGWNRAEEKRCSKLNDQGEEVNFAGRYSCGRACEGVYDCGIHPCELKCHPHPIKPLICPMSPSQITSCACGQTPLALLSAPSRKDCLAAIPTCGNRCPKSRPCGHQCTLNCHEDPCPPCHEEMVKPCRCGESMLVIGCDELREIAERGDDVTCERVCKALRKHECGRVCCPLSYQAKNRRARRNEIGQIAESDDLHECHLTCGRTLSCGLHTCQRKDHKGACGRCLQASYDELICHCGHTVVYPPVACGTTINCLYPCARPAPSCGHPRSPHQCHENPNCPPCPFLVNKPCACGKDTSIKNIRCSQEKVSCGQACGELLGCGYHRCQKPCHPPGECEDCRQTCNKPKRICGHACTMPCHAPAKCPEADPCQAIITMSCACGHVQQRTSCGANGNNTTSREKTTLKCNSECAIRQRNARLADALGITSAGARGQEVEWEGESKSFAGANLGFVKMVEKTLDEFIKGTKSSMILPYMPQAKRTFVISLADVYRLNRELVDAEPNRSVMIRRRTDTRIPSPLLSSIAQPASAAGKNLGGLANLRAPVPTPAARLGRGGVAPAPRTWTAALGNGGSGASTRTSSPLPPANTTDRAPTPVAPLASVSGAMASSATSQGGSAGVNTHGPSVSGPRVEKVLGEVGKVEEGDWDVSDTE